MADAAWWFSDDRSVVHGIEAGAVARYVEVDAETGNLRRAVDVGEGASLLPASRHPWRTDITAAAHLSPGSALLGTEDGRVLLLDTRAHPPRLSLVRSLGGSITHIAVAGLRRRRPAPLGRGR